MWLLFKHHLLRIINFALSNSWNFHALHMLLLHTISIVNSGCCLPFLALACGAIVRSLGPVFDELSLNKWVAVFHIARVHIPSTFTPIITTINQIPAPHSRSCIQRRVDHALAVFIDLILELVLTCFTRFRNLKFLV